MKLSLWNFLLIIYFLFSCSENEEPQGVEETFWVYSYTVPCDPSSNKSSTCLGISYAAEFDYDFFSLERIPLEIEGFTFKPTYVQRVLVRKIENTTTGEIKRKLIRVLAEEKDNYDLIEGGWKVQKFMGEDLPNEKFPKGQSVSVLPGIRMAVSTDGCNQITLQIQKLGSDKILSFGTMTMTLKACPSTWPRLIPFPGISEKFKQDGNILTFYSDTESEIAVWEKLN